ncbi:hypothetical protein LEP1GSC056_3691 [Leptospira borgpetersenii str. Brem 328]|uniref:Uncharacterized protein n=1 Tax=Leptospira borgpetersenii str. Brem 328 TaxID=1049780 RepID=A0ABC9SCB4_LEPBO|nr:hypothetical protein LEP1GSC056_3691 [Leptospira borgpetersenii str. Brem 328]
MGGGYHSRSPEEFRKFLEENRKQSSGGKFSRVRLIFILEPVSKLPIKKVKSNDRACEIKRCKIIFRFSFPTN